MSDLPPTPPFPPRLAGVLNVDKPAGLSSARVVGQVKRLLPKGTKIGHAGTLDPFATGVLLLLVGKATKSCEQLMGQRKGYEATIQFGATTATDDLESPSLPFPGATERGPMLTIQQLRSAAEKLVGEIEQTPPVYSALKLGGRPAYELARKGLHVETKPRRVTIYSLDVLDFVWPIARINVECGRGTYIRSIARDLGAMLEVGGYLTQLRRTFVGDFHVKDAVTVEQLIAKGVESNLRQVG